MTTLPEPSAQPTRPDPRNAPIDEIGEIARGSRTLQAVLRRTVRFALAPFESTTDDPKHNPYAAFPPMRGLGAYNEIDVDVVGVPDPTTGYLVNIVEVDAAVRTAVVPWLGARFRSQFAPRGAPLDPATTVVEIADRIAGALETPPPGAPERTVVLVRWHLAPTLSYAVRRSMTTTPIATPVDVELRQRFEFSASHRLHCPEYDEATNRAYFGKCNNPAGHGHNYRVDVAVAVPLRNAHTCSLQAVEAVVDRTVVARFDHKHLNSDVPEFATLNPSVEHIAKVAHDLLVQPIAALGGRLRTVTVWETEKTCCTYPATASAEIAESLPRS
jgi:6-pyruvoyltetrahydropterin/6-carboxytetrahydropterin synthase